MILGAGRPILLFFLQCVSSLDHSERNCGQRVVRRFLEPGRHDPPVLWTSPGAGNTMMRQLIETGTGVHTGSVYGDSSLLKELPGEGRCDDTVAIVKAHPAHRPYEFLFEQQERIEAPCSHYLVSDPLCSARLARHRAMCQNIFFRRAIVVVRHPMKASVAEFQRLIAYEASHSHRRHRKLQLKSSDENPHTASIEHLWTERRQEFVRFAKAAGREFISDWKQYAKAKNHGFPLHFLRFEALVYGPLVKRTQVLRAMLSFIGIPAANNNLLHCTFERVNAASTFRRKHIAHKWPLDIACDIWSRIRPLASALQYGAYPECNLFINTSIDVTLIDLARTATFALSRFDNHAMLPIYLNTSFSHHEEGMYADEINSTKHHDDFTSNPNQKLQPTPNKKKKIFFSQSLKLATMCPLSNSFQKNTRTATTWIPLLADYTFVLANCTSENAQITLRHQAAHSTRTTVIMDWKRSSDLDGFLNIGTRSLGPGWAEVSVGSCENVEISGGRRQLIWNCGQIDQFNNSVQIANSRVKHERLIVAAAVHHTSALALNWAMHLENLGITEYIIGCLDQASFANLYGLRAPCFFTKMAAMISSELLNSDYSRTVRLTLSFFSILSKVDANILVVQTRVIMPIKSMYYTPAYLTSSDSSILAMPLIKTLRHYSGLWFWRGRQGINKICNILQEYIVSNKTLTLRNDDMWMLLDFACDNSLDKKLLSVMSTDHLIVYCDKDYNEKQVTNYGNAFAIQLCTVDLFRTRYLFHEKELQSKLAWIFGTKHPAMTVRYWTLATAIHGHRLRNPFGEFLAYLKAHSYTSPSDQLSPRALALNQGVSKYAIKVAVLLRVAEESQSLLQSQVDAWGAASEIHGFFVDIYIIWSSRVVISFWSRVRILYAANFKEAVDSAVDSSWIAVVQPGVLPTNELSQWFSRELLFRASGPYPGFVADALQVRSPLCFEFNDSDTCTSRTISGLASCEPWLSAAIIGAQLSNGSFVPVLNVSNPPWTDRRKKYDVTVPLVLQRGDKTQQTLLPWADRLPRVQDFLEAWDPDKDTTLRDLDATVFGNDESILWSIHQRAPPFVIIRRQQAIGVLSGSSIKLMRIRGARALLVSEHECPRNARKKLMPGLASVKEWMFDPGREEEALTALLDSGIRLFIVEALGGLANRLRSITTAMTASARLGLPLVVSWSPDIESEAKASDILDLGASSLMVVNRSWPGEKWSNTIIADQNRSTLQMNNNRLIQELVLEDEHKFIIMDAGNGHLYIRSQMHLLVSPRSSASLGYTLVDVRTAIRRLIPANQVQMARGDFKESSSNCVAVHIRAQWNESRLAKQVLVEEIDKESVLKLWYANESSRVNASKILNVSQRKILDRISHPATKRNRNLCLANKFYDRLANSYNSTPSIYVACDHPNCVSLINRSVLSGRVHALENLSYCRDSSVRSRHCQQLAFADLLNLAHCSKLVVSTHSSFSDAASLLSNSFSHVDTFLFPGTPRDQYVETACTSPKQKRIKSKPQGSLRSTTTHTTNHTEKELELKPVTNGLISSVPG